MTCPSRDRLDENSDLGDEGRDLEWSCLAEKSQEGTDPGSYTTDSQSVLSFSRFS